ncbi:hypothetical protein L6654_42655 [Bradyrhizobium sp. WYCCWR 13023]|uniref:Uncharacterized protein n=1 Tax=Bradyrhizobium zhengyangense TaxID=2911009 RepID=A0A9X1RF32_9BRAD|nr:hypothetical protein [Bradyrhizobium zhengyangense]MCG2633217.1 hypothetical protein [Bradyrhizobium zhengyangense]
MGPIYCDTYRDASGADVENVPSICDRLRDVMPQIGEPRGDAAIVFQHAMDRTVELVAAGVAERMFLDGEPVPSVSDVEQWVAYALLVASSPDAADRFIATCESMDAIFCVQTQTFSLRWQPY